MATSQEKLLQLLNEKNLPYRPFDPVNLVLDQMGPSDEHENANTKIVATGVPGRGYSGSVEVWYSRLSLIAFEGILIRDENFFTPQTLLDEINKRLEVEIFLDDLEPFTVPQIDDGNPHNVTLVAKPDSGGWLDSCTLQVQKGKRFLDVSIYRQDLGAFKHYVSEQSGFKSARMLLWGTDFSSIQREMKIVASKFTDLDTVRQALITAGLTGSFGLGVPSDRATSQVPDANQKFQRVVTVYLSSGTYAGALYLHYNPF